MGRDNHEAWFHYAETSNSMATSQDDVFMPKDSTVILEDGEMNETDRKLEVFKWFCLMIKPLKNHPKGAVQVNLKDLVLRNLSYEHYSYNFSGVICFSYHYLFYNTNYPPLYSAINAN